MLDSGSSSRLVSEFRPMDKMAKDIAKQYGGSPRKISGVFEALKGSCLQPPVKSPTFLLSSPVAISIITSRILAEKKLMDEEMSRVKPQSGRHTVFHLSIPHNATDETERPWFHTKAALGHRLEATSQRPPICLRRRRSVNGLDASGGPLAACPTQLASFDEPLPTTVPFLGRESLGLPLCHKGEQSRRIDAFPAVGTRYFHARQNCQITDYLSTLHKSLVSLLLSS